MLAVTDVRDETCTCDRLVREQNGVFVVAVMLANREPHASWFTAPVHENLTDAALYGAQLTRVLLELETDPDANVTFPRPDTLVRNKRCFENVVAHARDHCAGFQPHAHGMKEEFLSYVARYVGVAWVPAGTIFTVARDARGCETIVFPDDPPWVRLSLPSEPQSDVVGAEAHSRAQVPALAPPRIERRPSPAVQRERDIDLLLAQAGVTRDMAIAALDNNNGDVVSAIFELTSTAPPVPVPIARQPTIERRPSPAVQRERDINFLMAREGVTRDMAIAALDNNNGHIMDARFELTSTLPLRARTPVPALVPVPVPVPVRVEPAD